MVELAAIGATRGFMSKNSVSIEIKGVQKHFYFTFFVEISTFSTVFGYGGPFMDLQKGSKKVV
jgi:hypothetical protein